MVFCPGGCCRTTDWLGGFGRGGVGAVEGLDSANGGLLGLNSFALGFKVDFFT